MLCGAVPFGLLQLLHRHNAVHARPLLRHGQRLFLAPGWSEQVALC